VVSAEQVAETRPRHPTPLSVSAIGDWLSARGIPHQFGHPASQSITGVSLSSQRILPGDLYAALPGSRAHGAEFAGDAVSAGAVCVLTDAAGVERLDPVMPTIMVAQPRAVLGELSAFIYGRPADRLTLIGVTGTQGKTTTSRLAEGGLLGAGIPASVIGTVGTRLNGHDLATTLTTPEAPDLQALFARMCEDRATACVMEVSSHALVMGRVDGVRFDVAVFTNLGRDHLDFHRDVEDYYRAKAALFTPERARLGLVNVDDEHGRRLSMEAAIPVRTFSARGAPADWRAEELKLSAEGSMFTVVGPRGESWRTGVPLPGEFNVANALAAIAACAEAGFSGADVAAGVASGGGVPGRLERISEGQDFVVVVDYAHKPDAIEAALATLRPLTTGSLLVVLGAGGDRDAGKRVIMGELAAKLADLVVVTDDNPRSEDPSLIRAELLLGAAKGAAEVHEIGDRRAAIREVVRRARSGDVVLIAGKGHETGQEIKGVIYPFDDRVVAAEELRAR
jgi:UDP-N-acetylmuramoyl-L-alanyl-D-glutamate--2,6-diaminopimelate ligase